MKQRVFDVKGDSHKPAEHYKVYSMWLHMHLRVGQHSNYLDCSIHDDWYLYSNFKNWVLAHDVWRDLALDKDLLVVGNKMYGPDTCCLIPQWLNKFIVERKGVSGKLTGAFFVKRLANGPRPYQAKYVVPDHTKKNYQQQKHIGYFATELEAHTAWKAAKHTEACRIADGIQDQRIANALRTRYL